MGSLLDPLADKLLVISLMIIILEIYNDFYISFVIILIILREIIISFFRFYFYSKKNYIIKVNDYGKIKTYMQLLSITFLIAFPPLYNNINILGIILLYISFLFTLLSLYHYVKFLFK